MVESTHAHPGIDWAWKLQKPLLLAELKQFENYFHWGIIKRFPVIITQELRNHLNG